METAGIKSRFREIYTVLNKMQITIYHPEVLFQRNMLPNETIKVKGIGRE